MIPYRAIIIIIIIMIIIIIIIIIITVAYRYSTVGYLAKNTDGIDVIKLLLRRLLEEG